MIGAPEHAERYRQMGALVSREGIDRGEIARLVGLTGLVAALAIGVAVGGRPALYASGLWVDGGSPTISPTLFEPTPTPGATPSSEPASGGQGVVDAAAPAGQAGLPDAKALAGAIATVPTKGLAATSGIVLDGATGQQLYAQRATTPLIPASTMKLLTSAAALHVLGADTRFTTRVLQPATGKLVLVGGGDPYLASTSDKYPHPASSAVLAKQTADALKKAGQKSVTLGFDESLFAGPNWNPTWPGSYHDQVTTISALWIDKGRETPKSGISLTPAATAAVTFATQLKAQGITVQGTPAAARGTGAELARVESLPVATIVQEVLVHSDNSAAEVLLRHVGRVQKTGASFTGGAAGIERALAELKVPTQGLAITDGSGLSRSNLVPAATLAGAVRAAVVDDELRPLVEGLPAAGAIGTLSSRFWTPAAEGGRGWVRAKTGTLTKVSTLAGVTRTAGGRDVVFCFMANNQSDEWGARVWLDQVAAVVTTSK